MRLAYVYSRHPVVSHTFCNSEMLALEAMGFDLEIVSLNPPPDSLRHERLEQLRAEIHYPPPGAVLDAIPPHSQAPMHVRGGCGAGAAREERKRIPAASRDTLLFSAYHARQPLRRIIYSTA